MTDPLAAPGVALSAERLIALRRIGSGSDSDPVLAALPGGHATRHRGQGLEVADTRDYVAGDDIRHLDRGTTARTGRLHVRRFHEDRDRVTLLVADFRPAMVWGVRRALRSVAAAEALGLIGWRSVESGGRVGLLALTAGAPVIVPVRGRVRGMLDVIGGLVRAHAGAVASVAAGQRGDPPLDRALQRAERLTPAGAEIVIVSGFDSPGEDLEGSLGRIARRRSPRLLLMTATGALPGGRYPVRLSDGRRLIARVPETAPSLPAEARIAGRPALVLQASEPVETLAGRLRPGPGGGWSA